LDFQLNVLYLSSWFPLPPDNGSRQRAYYILRGLARTHHVTCIALMDSEQTAESKATLEQWGARVVTLPRRVFQPMRRRALTNFFHPQPRFLADTFDPAAAKIIAEYANATCDVIVAGELSMAVYAAQLNHRAKIFDDVEVGIFADAYENARGVARWRKKLTWTKFARYLKALARQFHALTVVSEIERARAVGLGIAPAKLTLIPNGVECEGDDPLPSAFRPFTLIYNGALTYSANYDAMRYFVREILPRVRAVEPRVQLEITGRAPQFAINELSQDNCVSFTGYVQDVRRQVQTSAVCVVPLREGGGTRLKILEAMAVGTPVVATRKGAEGLDLTPDQHFLLADSPDDFARAILQLLSDKELRARLTRAARARVCAEYDWTLIGEHFNRLLMKCAPQDLC